MSYQNNGLVEDAWRKEVFKRISILCRRAYEYGIILLHENCHGWAATDSKKSLELIEITEARGFALLFDVGNPVVHGYDGFKSRESVFPYVRHVHVKDAVLEAGGNEIFTCPGEGNAHLLKCIDFIFQNGYNETRSIEPHVRLIAHRKIGICDSDILSKTYVEYGETFMEHLSWRVNHE
jgi:L-ribulose-5-phosphate 3-epimerase